MMEGRDDHPGAALPVHPENPNQLKFLTFALAMIILERCIVPYPLTSRDKVCDHATRRLCPPRLYLDLVPVSSLHTVYGKVRM
jgi:hypothetical protein